MENLNEKQQIEKMAKVIKSSLDGLGCGNFNFTGEEISTMFAKALYTAGYRKQEWVSVDERLPEENGRYLACIKISHLAFDIPPMVVIMGYNKIHGFDTISGEETVTHWMHLPEAPKMKGGVE